MTDDHVSLVRPVLPVRKRRPLATVAIALAAAGAGAAIAIARIGEPNVTVLPSTPTTIVQLPQWPATVPPAPAVEVSAPAPAPVMAADEPDAASAPSEPPRATSPALDAACISALSPEEEAPELPASCFWDDGFPAISKDGALVVTKYYPDDGGRGNPGLSIHFLDAKTSKLVRDVTILDPDEIDVLYTDDEARRAKLRARLNAKIAQRAAVAQQLIDARGYRTLEPLGVYDANSEEQDIDRTRVHVEFDGAAARAIDPASSRVLWQHRFDVARLKAASDDDDCSGWYLRQLTLAWDPTTRTVLATSEHDMGGCMCATITTERVKRMP